MKFPSGRTEEFEDFRRAEANISFSQSEDFIDQVVIWHLTAGGADDVRGFAGRFLDRWGTARSTDGASLDDFIDTLIDEDTSDSTQSFVSLPQDGILPGFSITMADGRFAAAAFYSFDP